MDKEESGNTNLRIKLQIHHNSYVVSKIKRKDARCFYHHQEMNGLTKKIG